MKLEDLPITHTADVPEGYIDIMGHMNVMWYTHLFDNAIYGALDLIGLDLDYMQSNSAGGFALEAHTRYLAEVRVGQNVTIRTRMLARSAKRFHMISFMVNDSTQKLAATFEVVGAHIDMKIRRMSPMPKSVSNKLDSMIQEHQLLNWPAPICGSMRP